MKDIEWMPAEDYSIPSVCPTLGPEITALAAELVEKCLREFHVSLEDFCIRSAEFQGLDIVAGGAEIHQWTEVTPTHHRCYGLFPAGTEWDATQWAAMDWKKRIPYIEETWSPWSLERGLKEHWPHV